MKSKNTIGLILGILFFIIILFLGNIEPNNPKISITLAITVLMATWWITEAIPLAVTALLPLVLFPIFGITNGKEVSSSYVNDVIFLFMGGFMIALTMQKWNLHRRIALKIMMFTGVSPSKVIAGFMLATAFLSMWISNTATAMMMLPIAISILGEFENIFNEKDLKRYSIALLLSIAYSASIGGIATLVGTPPNLVFTKIMNISFPNAPEIGFGQWMFFAFPLSIFMLISLWLLMYLFLFRNIRPTNVISSNIFKTQHSQLGKYSFEEKIVTIGFVLFALLLLFRVDIKISSFIIPGWSNLLPNPKFINDGTIAIAISILFFIIPAKENKKTNILDWKTANKLPWHIIILFGGGFALAKGFVSSGLSLWIGELIENSVFENPFFNILLITSVMIFLTEVTSNTATTQILLPILAGLAISTKTNPLIYMVPATIAASMAFMLPVATPPNAIVFGSGKIKISEMARMGLILNIIAIILVSIFVYYLGFNIFNINNELPIWAK